MEGLGDSFESQVVRAADEDRLCPEDPLEEVEQVQIAPSLIRMTSAG